MALIPFGGNTIKSIQRGQTDVNVTSTSNDHFSTDTTITSVNMDKSIVNVTGQAVKGSTAADQAFAALTSSTNIRCTTGYYGAIVSDAVRVSWEVIEFN